MERKIVCCAPILCLCFKLERVYRIRAVHYWIIVKKMAKLCDLMFLGFIVYDVAVKDRRYTSSINYPSFC